MTERETEQHQQPILGLFALIKLRPFHFLLLLATVVLIWPAFAGASAEAGAPHDERNWFDFAWRAINFAVLAGLLYWLLAAKVKDFFYVRQKDIRESLTESDRVRAEAKSKYAEYDAKLEKAIAEIREMEETILLQGEAERERILVEAKKNAEKMKHDAQKRMEQEMLKARNDLKVEALRLSVTMAEDMLRKHMTVKDNIGLVEEYIAKVGEKQ